MQLGARAYDPAIGRFVSVDSVLALANPIQNNGYAYSANNPITASDPSGDCYVSGKGSVDALNFHSNCGGGSGIAAPQEASPVGNNRSDYSPVWNREARALDAVLKDTLDQLDLSGIDLGGFFGGASQTGSHGGGLCEAARVYVPVGACNADEAAATDGHVADILDAAGDVSQLLFSICMADFANPTCGSLETADSLSAGASSWLRAGALRAADGITSATTLADMFADGAPTASDLIMYGRLQGWKLEQTKTGPPTLVDANGVKRMVIKQGSVRTRGSENPHVELRNSEGQRIDPQGNEVSKRSLGNHTPIRWDLP